MDKWILVLAICFGLAACGSNGAKKNVSTKVEQVQPQDTKDRVEVLYFHGKKRCATCMAIEEHAREAVEAQFASSLFISQWKGGKETYENLTLYAFANARTAPDSFKSKIVEKINGLLK